MSSTILGASYREFPVAEDILRDARQTALADKANIVKIQRVGTVELLNPIQIFDITLRDSADLTRSRIGIQRLVRSNLFPYSHAFMVFHYENPCGREWRFSYLFKEDTAGHTTSAKRYTYLFGSRHHCRTAVDRFSLLADKEQDDKALLEAFSVESLTKEFYRELFDWYQWAIDESTGVTFPNNTKTPTDDREQNETKIIRMITRLMFVWFIKPKNLVPDRLIDP